MLGKEKSILYVDDTVEQRYAMRRILEGDGYRVVEAGTGAEALKALQPELQAVILDVKLPDMSGYDVCRAIKANPSTAGIPVLQISASFTDPTLRSVALSGGADAYVAQPVYPQELLNLVAALIRSHRSENMARFLAAFSLSISASLDVKSTLLSICTSLVPTFADSCYLHLSQESGLSQQFQSSTEQFQQLATEIGNAGKTKLLQLPGSSTSVLAVPLETGRNLLGAAIFVLETSGRTYTSENIPFGEDLATRIALALQNAQLHAAQQATQSALVQSEKIAAAGRLAAAIAHELNNPLEAVVNLTYLIEISPETPEKIKKYAQDALGELGRLSHITRQTLGFYRELTSPQPFDLSESVEETLQLYSSRMRGKSIEVKTNYASPLVLTAVKGEIRQVVSNLLLNSLDAMSEGGQLEIETRRADDGAAVLRVTDNGKGIPKATMGRIFEPFFTTKKDTGTGLGLWVSDNIVRKHGGHIEIKSETSGKNRGTTMEIFFNAVPTVA